MSGLLHIVAVAARTPVGLTAERSAAAVRARVSRVGEYPFALGAAGELLRCARDPLLPPTLPWAQRMTLMARDALSQVLAATPAASPLHAHVHLALPPERPGFRAADAGRLAREVVRDAPCIVADVQCSLDGHAGGLRALHAATSLSLGPHKLHIICGADSWLDDLLLDRLDAQRRLQRAGVRDGFIPGEAAAALVLADTAALTHHRLRSLASVRAAAIADEDRSPTDPIGLLGEGLTRAIEAACAPLRVAHERIDDVYCDINGERHRTDDWGFTLLRTSGLFHDGADYRSATDVWGDVGAASGVLGCVLAVAAWRRGYARGPSALVWGASSTGLRGAALLAGPTR